MKNIITLGIVGVGGYLLYNFLQQNGLDIGTGATANTGTTTTNGNVAVSNNATQGNSGSVSTTPSLRDRLIATVTQAVGDPTVSMNLDHWSYFYQVTTNREVTPAQFDIAMQALSSRDQALTLDQFLTLWGNAGLALGNLLRRGNQQIGIGQWLYLNNPTIRQWTM